MTTIARFPPADYDPPAEVGLRLVRTSSVDPRRHTVRTLSEREREIFVLIARGRTNEEIADTVGLSKSTVKKYVSELFRKTASRDRVALVIAAYESGLVRARFPATP